MLGKNFQPPCRPEEATYLRKHTKFLTCGEDNLILRGVNLYGEKEWELIQDRFLQDRTVHDISKRYFKLCLMLYKGNGIHIDDKGELEEPPKFESVDDVDEAKASSLAKVDPPAVLNVRRWSIAEDLTLLKAVPIFGTMWAEVAARYIPHRDRGHLRKRFQVLQRRIRAAVDREKKAPSPKLPKSPKAKKGHPDHVNFRTSSRSFLLKDKSLPLPTRKSRPGPISPGLNMSETMLSKGSSTLLEEGSRAAFENLVNDPDEASRVPIPKQKSIVQPSISSTSKTKSSLFAGVMSRVNEASGGERKNDEEGLKKLSAVAAMDRLMPPPKAGTEDKTASTLDVKKPSDTDPGTPIRRQSKRLKAKDSQSPAASELFSPAQSLHFFGSPSNTLATFPGGESSNAANVQLCGQELKSVFDNSNSQQSHLSERLTNFELPETPSPSKSPSDRLSSTPLFGPDAGMLENDMEAASALSALSSPPANSADAPKDEYAGPAKKRKSLFATVMGNVTT